MKGEGGRGGERGREAEKVMEREGDDWIEKRLKGKEKYWLKKGRR
jgi:hypothetical protein